ncbi:MAG TPA: DnaJ C-terminal domain-containing protein [Microlunatus sp.]
MSQDLTLSLEEVMTGVDHVVTVSRPSPCPRCAGRGSRLGTTPRRCQQCGGTGQRTKASRHGPLTVGQVTACPACAGRGRVIDPCPTCQGTGWAARIEKVTIRIPPGIPEGATLRLAGQGMPSPVPGGPTGDLFVNIHTATDPLFRRVGADLWHDLHIRACDAALGVTTAVPLPGGQARIRVPPGTQPGSVLRVPGNGLPRYDEDGRGNLRLTVILDIPRQLDPPQRQLYEQLRAADDRSPVVESRSTTSESEEPEIARADQRMAAGGWDDTATMLIFASALLVVAGIANLVVGITPFGAPDLFLAGTVGPGPRTVAWIMIIVGAVELLGGAAIWAGRRTSRRHDQSLSARAAQK